ncbi:hypothetical protein D9M71_290200 [compost metagenome]
MESPSRTECYVGQAQAFVQNAGGREKSISLKISEYACTALYMTELTYSPAQHVNYAYTGLTH